MYASRRYLKEKQAFSSPLETSYCKQASTYFHVCFCSPLVRINVLTHDDASFSESKPLSYLQNRHGPLLILRVVFLSLFEGALLPNVSQIVERELAIRSWASISNRRRLQNRTHELRACLTCPVLVLGRTAEGRDDVI